MNSSRLAVPIVSLDTDFRRALSVARELGVGGIEIDGRYGIDLLTLSETGVRQIRKWLDDAGLQVAAVSFPTRRGYSDQDQLEARVGATKQMMLQAQRLGATVLLGRLGDIPAKEDSGNWQVLIDVLTDLGRTGQQAGAFFCAEAGQSSPEDLRQVIEAVPEGSLQVHLVTGALLVHGYDPAEAAMTWLLILDMSMPQTLSPERLPDTEEQFHWVLVKSTCHQCWQYLKNEVIGAGLPLRQFQHIGQRLQRSSWQL